MSDDLPILATLGYNEQLVLVYLDKQYSLGKGFLNLQEIANGTKLNYSTLRNKIDTLQESKFVYSTKRGKERVVRITNKGKNAITEWQKINLGKEIIEELEATLAMIEAEGE